MAGHFVVISFVSCPLSVDLGDGGAAWQWDKDVPCCPRCYEPLLPHGEEDTKHAPVKSDPRTESDVLECEYCGWTKAIQFS